MKHKLLIPLSIFSLLLGLVSALLIFLTQYPLLWAGTLLATASGPLFMMLVIGSGRMARTSARLPTMQILSITGLLITCYAIFSSKQVLVGNNLAALLTSLFGAGYVQWYVRWYSSYGREKSESLVKGKQLPELPFERLDGTRFTSQSFVGKKTLLVFFRGNWCPLCVAQLKEVCQQADRLAAANVQVHFISNQSVDKSRELTRMLALPEHFEILYDRDLCAARILNIEAPGGTPLGITGYPADTLMATVLALDELGRLIFGDETDNYRVRPHPDTFIPILESH